MKNRRLTLVAFLLCASLIVGFGYAAVSDTLTINGTATIDITGANTEFDGKVMFVNPTAANAKDTFTLDTTGDIGTVEVHSLTLAGTTATFTVYVKNEYHLPVYVTPQIDTSSALFDASLISISSNWQSKTHEIAAGEKLVYTLTVTCVEPKDATTTFAIGFTCTDVIAEGVDYVAYTGTPAGGVQ